MNYEQALKDLGQIIVHNSGVSMLPFIREGKDLMVITDKDLYCKDHELRKYDAVLFVRRGVTGRGQYVMHRIMRLYEDHSYGIIGDNCIEEERVPYEDILGVLTEIHREKKVVSVTSKVYRRLVYLWWMCFPIRFFYKKTRYLLGKAVRRIGGR